VCGLPLDPSSVWILNRLQVTSLSTDNFTLGIGIECNKKIVPSSMTFST
jgi:hypothetical protein